jgi:hypothetical protein
MSPSAPAWSSALIPALCVLAFAAPASLAQFSSDPGVQLEVGANAGNMSKVRHHQLGYAVSWQGPQFDGGNTLVQLLTHDGLPLLAAGGVQVTDAQLTGNFEDYGFDVDAAGNMLVAFRDNSSGSVVIRLQKVAPDGSLPWGANGVVVPGGPEGGDSPHTPGVTCLTDGSYAVKFSRGSTTSTATSRACYQKVSADGQLLWNGGQAVVLAPASNGYIAADMAPGADGSVLAFHYSIGSFTVSRRIVVQKLDGATGAPVWNGGNPVPVQLTSTLQIGNFPQVVSDGSNGALVSWYETASPLQCFVQRIDGDGAAVFPAGGATATNGTVAGQQRVSPHVAFDAATQTTYMVFSETNTSQGASGIGAQAFDATGNRLWGDAGVMVVPIGDTGHSSTFARASLMQGGMIATWFETATSGGSQTVNAAGLLADGQVAWSPAVLAVNTMGGTKARLDVVGSLAGPTVAAYGSNAGVLNIHASRINADGTLGNLPPGCGTADFDGDGDTGTDADIEAFFACLAGNCCATCYPGGADFNNDGDTGTDADIESFFRVLAGGDC